MYKFRIHNRINNILKLLSCFAIMLFLVSVTLSYEIAPLNKLSNWVDKVEKNIEINGAKGKAILNDLYDTSLEKAQYALLSPIMDAVKATTKTLNDHHLCNLTDDDVVNILFRTNSEFRNNIKNLSLDVSNPKRSDMVVSCSKLMGCILKSEDSRKLRDSLSYCRLIVDNQYIEEYNNNYNLSSLSQGNEGYETYRNNTLDDSSYDILYDVYILAKILFDSPEEPTEVLFYDLPDISAVYQDPEPEVQVYKNMYNPHYTRIIMPGGNNGDPDNPGNDGGDGSDGNDEGGTNVNGEIDDDFGEFVEVVTHEVDGWDGSEFLGNDCVDGFQVEGFEGYSYTEEITGHVSGNVLTPSQYIAYMVSNIDNLSCNGDGICSAWELDTCSDCTHVPGLNPNHGGGNNDPDNPAVSLFSGDEETVTCFSSCKNVPCTAKSCDRLACYAKCLCVNLESSQWDVLENFGLSSTFKLKFCTVPVLDHKVVTTKKVNNLEQVISEIYNVIWNLRNSGQLQINKKTREYLDSSLQNNDFSKQLSFAIEAYNKIPQSKGSEKQQMDDQVNLNTAMMENILGFETSTEPSGIGRNKYLVKGGPVEAGVLIDTTSQNSHPYDDADLDRLQASLQSEHLSSMDSELSEFLESNLNFWFIVKDSFESFSDTAKSLANKK